MTKIAPGQLYYTKCFYGGYSDQTSCDVWLLILTADYDKNKVSYLIKGKTPPLIHSSILYDLEKSLGAYTLQ